MQWLEAAPTWTDVLVAVLAPVLRPVAYLPVVCAATLFHVETLCGREWMFVDVRSMWISKCVWMCVILSGCLWM